MDSRAIDSLEKIRQQYDQAPYPRVPLETSPKRNYELLYKYSLVTPYYLRYQTVIDPKGKLILDAGCGTGFNALILAEANPGAQIVGVDISDASIQLADQRLKFHGFETAEFHVLSIEDLSQLDRQFDYINCDETLYLLPDPIAGLEAMKAVLKPDGIIRFNLHSALQRRHFYRSQALFKRLGVLNDGQTDEAVQAVVNTMQRLRPDTTMRATAWKSEWEQTEHRGQILVNHLLLGDKGYTIPDLFAMLDAADLEFISMVNWRHWDVTDLFKDPENLPAVWAMSLESASIAERLRLYELLHPIHRLLDCWCGHLDQIDPGLLLDEWTDTEWQTAQVHLHPQLHQDEVKQDLITCIAESQSFEISRYIPLPALGPVMVQSALAATLLPLWDGPQSVMSLVERHLMTQPRDPVTLEPITKEAAFMQVKRLLAQLNSFLYILLERC
ncbi:MAG TPA: class I SAM-dependent methyltransferase [Crinalium sp.]|jgi:ubiquinone/menaquinone biosynthesis C-methylase UbiE